MTTKPPDAPGPSSITGAPSAGAPHTAPKTLPGERDRFGNLPAIEVELVHEVRRPPTVEKVWTMLEVWTQNRVYSIDLSMVCHQVVDIATQKPVPDHDLIGARLLGGQFNEDGKTHLSHPFPRPGTEAVFEQARPNRGVVFSHSSPVTRVVLRLRQITIVTGGEQPTWDQIAKAGRTTTLPPEE